jgi:hypothetical protein
MRVLDAHRVFAEGIEEACVAPVLVDDAADLWWHALSLSHEQVAKVQVGMNEPVGRVQPCNQPTSSSGVDGMVEFRASQPGLELV